MAEIPIPAGQGVPLVDMVTKLFPAPTMAALDARYAAAPPESEPEAPVTPLIGWVDVVTGDEPRPNALHVIWKGGAAQPANFTAADIHFRVTPVVAEPEEPEEPEEPVEPGDPEPITAFSIFGNASPGAVTVANDGVDWEVGSRFYGTKPITVVGARLWIPEGASGAWLTSPITFRAWGEDWGTGELVSTVPAAAPAATAVVQGPRAAGTWAEVLFPAPIPLAAVASGATGPDCIAVSAKVDGKVYQVTSVGDNHVASVQEPAVVLAEATFPRGFATPDTPGRSHYGLDILFTVTT